MPSPFPGMDPYLEDSARWPSFHTALVTTIMENRSAYELEIDYGRDPLPPLLPPDDEWAAALLHKAGKRSGGR